MRHRTQKGHAQKKIPQYWWDFEGDPIKHVIVESDNDKFPVVARIMCGTDCENAIAFAERIIADLQSGRRNPRWMAKKLRHT